MGNLGDLFVGHENVHDLTCARRSRKVAEHEQWKVIATFFGIGFVGCVYVPPWIQNTVSYSDIRRREREKIYF
jgi:hypothetical protein